MATSNKIRALDRLPFDFEDGLLVKGTGVDALVDISTDAASAASQSEIAAAVSAGIAQDAADGVSVSAALAAQTVTAGALAQSSMLSAQSAASVAAGHAASASSVVQQDLSGVNAAALHRSPNAVTAMFIYDTSKDSDGGAWTERCQHTSWYAEDINGKWLGAQSSEFQARNVGATLGAELVTNGTFDTDTTGWTTTGSVSVDTSGVTLTNTGASFPSLRQTVAITPGQTYRLVLKHSQSWLLTGGHFFSFYAGGTEIGASRINFSNTASQTDVIYVTAPAGATDINFQSNAGNTDGLRSVTWDDISVREVTAQTTQASDYFQLTTDGKFYKLNAGSGTTEVFRGNKRDFPRLSAIVAEAGSVTIYDLTEPGRPMWMRFNRVQNGIAGYDGVSSKVSSCYAQNALFAVGANGASNEYQSGLQLANFASDAFMRIRGYAVYGLDRLGSVSQRNIPVQTQINSVTRLASGYINAVAMTVLPDAPVDPVTGLKVPTIAVATAGGVSVIQHNGTVTTIGTGSTSLGAGALVFDNSKLIAGRATGGNPLFRRLGQKLVGVWGLAGNNNWGYFNSRTLIGGTSVIYGNWPAGVGLKIFDPSKVVTSLTNGLSAGITPTHNTGWLIGDIRRAYLADVDAGSVTGPELVTNGTFDTDVAGWTTGFGGVTLAAVSGELQVTTTSGYGRALFVFPTVIGKTYLMSGSIRRVSGSGTAFLGRSIDTVNGSGAPAILQTTSATFVSAAAFFVASTTSLCVCVGNSDNVSNSVYAADNISVREVVADRSYKASGATITGTLTKTEVATASQLVAYSGFSTTDYLQEPYSADLDFGTGEWSAGAWVNVPTNNAATGTIAERGYSSGASIKLDIDATNKLTATAYDGTTTRTVTTSAAYNTATWAKAEADYTTDGTLSIRVNGVKVAATRGTPLLTLNNADAVLTIGNSYALDAPFPGSIALLKLSATVPTAEQSVWMYEQEKQLFRAGAQCYLPDAGSILDLTYDDATDKWIAVSATNESEWSGLIRTSVTPVPAGSYTKAVASSGVQMLARSTTAPGVDITIPAYGLREELFKRAESTAKTNEQLVAYDYVGGFTASTTLDSTAITSVAGLTYPVSYIGAVVSGSGIPANTTIVAVSGTTIYLSAKATATATGVQVSFTDFILPVGMEAKAVTVAGLLKQEGTTKDYTKLFDGFKETIRFAVAPGYTAWVQIQAAKSAV